MESLQKLISIVKVVEISTNHHRSLNCEIEEYLNEDDIFSIEESVYENIVETDQLIHITLHINNIINSIDIYHYDLNKAIEEALNISKRHHTYSIDKL